MRLEVYTRRGIRIVTKHDRYVRELCGQLEESYDYLLTNIPLYSKRRRLVGEIDVLAFKGDACDAYEVKCSFRIVKARKQLKKIKKILDVNHAFFFCGSSNTIVSV